LIKSSHREDHGAAGVEHADTDEARGEGNADARDTAGRRWLLAERH